MTKKELLKAGGLTVLLLSGQMGVLTDQIQDQTIAVSIEGSEPVWIPFDRFAFRGDGSIIETAPEGDQVAAETSALATRRIHYINGPDQITAREAGVFARGVSKELSSAIAEQMLQKKRLWIEGPGPNDKPAEEVTND